MNTTTEQRQQVAATILQQLGGNKFCAMTGAKNLVATEHGLLLQLPARFAKHGITLVSIDLDATDTYRVSFQRIKRTRVAPGVTFSEPVEVKKVVGAYAEDLQRVFTEATGLDTHL